MERHLGPKTDLFGDLMRFWHCLIFHLVEKIYFTYFCQAPLHVLRAFPHRPIVRLKVPGLINFIILAAM